MRSKACARCQQRKKRCDRKRPACTPCVDAGVEDECAYATKAPLRFIEVTPPAATPKQDVSSEDGDTCSDARGEAGIKSMQVSGTTAAASATNWAGRHIPAVLTVAAPTATRYAQSLHHLSTSGARIAMLDRWFDHAFASSEAVPHGMYYIADRLMNTAAGTLTSDLGCLLQLGQVDSDPRLQLAAVRLYPSVLQSLRDSLRHLDPGTLVAIVHCIQINEQFSVLSGGERSSWTRHQSGIKAALKMHLEKNSNITKIDAAALVLPAGAQHAFVRNFRDFGLWHALQGGGNAEDYARIWSPEVLALETGNANAATSFDVLAVQVTTMVNICNRICAHPELAREKGALRFTTQLAELERLLHTWKADQVCREVSDRATSTSQTIEQSEVVPLNGYSTTDSASLDMCYWGCIIAFQACRLDLHSKSNIAPSTYGSFRPATTEPDRIEACGSSAAWNLLACVQYMTQESNGFMGLMSSMAPLRYTLDWFERIKDSQGILACRGLQKAAERRGICLDV